MNKWTDETTVFFSNLYLGPEDEDDEPIEGDVENYDEEIDEEDWEEEDWEDWDDDEEWDDEEVPSEESIAATDVIDGDFEVEESVDEETVD